MSFKSKLFKRIDDMQRETSDETSTAMLRSIRVLLEVALPKLSPNALVWEMDINDPDIHNASDNICGMVWQVEDLGEVNVLRVFDADRTMIFKEKLQDANNILDRVEHARVRIYHEGIDVTDALESYEAEDEDDEVQVSSLRPFPPLERPNKDVFGFPLPMNKAKNDNDDEEIVDL